MSTSEWIGFLVGAVYLFAGVLVFGAMALLLVGTAMVAII